MLPHKSNTNCKKEKIKFSQESKNFKNPILTGIGSLVPIFIWIELSSGNVHAL